MSSEESIAYLTGMVDERITMLGKFIAVEERLCTEQDTEEYRQSAARQLAGYRQELAKAERAKAFLTHPDAAHGQFCMRHGRAHLDTGDPSCQWQAGT